LLPLLAPRAPLPSRKGPQSDPRVFFPFSYCCETRQKLDDLGTYRLLSTPMSFIFALVIAPDPVEWRPAYPHIFFPHSDYLKRSELPSLALSPARFRGLCTYSPHQSPPWSPDFSTKRPSPTALFDRIVVHSPLPPLIGRLNLPLFSPPML